jgi:methionyl-tRNA formyltransferase
VSGWCDLNALSDELGYKYCSFQKITDCHSALNDFQPEVLFVVGLSQIVPENMLSIATKANVGFHPTALPAGRGRAAVAWLILQQMNGAATFFSLRGGVDDGPIFVQEPFSVIEEDDAADVEAKILRAEERALDKWLPRLKAGELFAYEQDHTCASWFGRRTPDDGEIDWRAPRLEILRLIRASAPPHPGAFSYCGDIKLKLLKASLVDRPETGVIGRILNVQSCGAFEIQALDGLLLIEKWNASGDWAPKVGLKLGYYQDAEIFALRQRISNLEKEIHSLKLQMSGGGNDIQ